MLDPRPPSAATADKEDAFLGRVVAAQNSIWMTALQEITDGAKVSHWIWWCWPAHAKVRETSMPTYSLRHTRDAIAWLRHSTLGPRFLELTCAACAHLESGIPPTKLFGSRTDCSKFHECVTLFGVAAAAVDMHAAAAVCDRALYLLRIPAHAHTSRVAAAELADDDLPPPSALRPPQTPHAADTPRPTILSSFAAALPAPPAEECVRLVVLSDTHGGHASLHVPAGDVLLHLGDICDKGRQEHLRSFAEWLQQQPHAHKVAIEGNHDRDLQAPGRVDLARELRGVAQVLRDETVSLSTRHGELRIHGSRWDTCEAERFAETLPLHSPPDVLVTHLPPAIETGRLGEKGSVTLRKLVEGLAIPLHLFGHIHGGRGVHMTPQTVFANCATFKNKPVVIDWHVRGRRAAMVWVPRD